MAVNKYKPHVYIIPEDDANRQIAVGFGNYFGISQRSMQILPVAGGWMLAIAKLHNDYLPILKSNSKAHVVVLIDSDQYASRIDEELDKVPDELRNRIFMLGTMPAPESLKTSTCMHFEQIGDLAL
jgi:hypothetical protein